MSLYPSLEDMKVDKMVRAQLEMSNQVTPACRFPGPDGNMPGNVPTACAGYPTIGGSYPSPQKSNAAIMYPELADFMGLELSQEVIEQNMPEYAANRQLATYQPNAVAVGPHAGMIAPLSGQSLGIQKANLTHGIRELTLCKGQDNKVGLRVSCINRGVFVSLVMAKSPAALAGLRFGDQILEIQGVSVAGFDMDKVHKMFKNAPVNGISVVVRDRPFERTLTLHKDSANRVGFQFKNGQITHLVKDSSAARNGLLTEHHLLEVDGQNVVGMKDKHITAIFDGLGQVITITIMPSFLYEHMMKKISTSLIKGKMDHSVPDI